MSHKLSDTYSLLHTPAPTIGFSLGDLIAGIGLVIDIVQSLDNSTGAQADYKELWCELKNIKNGLDCVQKILVEDPHEGQPTPSVLIIS